MVEKERINGQITAQMVRLIGADGKQAGIVSLQEALREAQKANLDLVEICKIIDFGQYHYQKERKMREARKNQHIVQIKEIKFGPNTDEHDFKFKLKNALKFLKQKNKVKFTVRFKGRQLAHKELGYELLDKIKEKLDGLIEVDSPTKNEGRTISMIVSSTKDFEKLYEKRKEELFD